MPFLLLLTLAAAPADLGYGSGTLDLGRISSTPDPTLTQQVLACAKNYGVAKIVRRGAAQVWSIATAASDKLESVNRPERLALLSILGRKLVGSEVDVLIPTSGGKGQPVTVTWDLDGTVTFESGPEVGALTDASMTAAKVKADFDVVGEFLDGDGKWDGPALSLVHQALSSLSKDELALVKGVAFRRGRASAGHRAQYERGDTTNWINVYDATYLFEKEQFTGKAAAPRPEALICLLHELGHAIADARFREKGLVSKAAADEFKKRFPEVAAATAAYDAAIAQLGPNPDPAKVKSLEETLAKVKAENEARFKEGDRLVRQMFANDNANAQGGRPAEKAFAAVLDVKKSPTKYGRGSPKEHFAECFTLCKNDPDALKRVSPAAADWFAANKHVELASKALDP